MQIAVVLVAVPWVGGHARLPLEYEKTSLADTTSPPSSGNEAKTWISAPDSLRINEGVVPLTRPAVISDCVSLSDKLGREERTLVPEKHAFDPFLVVCAELAISPNKDRVSSIGSQDDLVSRPDE